MTDIRKGVRVVHSWYGRGTVDEIERLPNHAFVTFDGEVCRRRVRLRDLLPEPERMPPTAAPPLPPIGRRYRLLVVQ